LNVVGGLRLQEPGGDLAIAAALASSVYDRTLPSEALFVGELGLGGEVRAVGQLERRLAEAAQLGLTIAYVPERGAPTRPTPLRVVPVARIQDLFQTLFR
jgi:DNA repair protein RadA/Sms